MRARVCDELAARPNDYKAFVEYAGEWGNDAEFAAYVARMRRPNEWGGELELAAAANALGRRIQVARRLLLYYRSSSPANTCHSQIMPPSIRNCCIMPLCDSHPAHPSFLSYLKSSPPPFTLNGEVFHAEHTSALGGAVHASGQYEPRDQAQPTCKSSGIAPYGRAQWAAAAAPPIELSYHGRSHYNSVQPAQPAGSEGSGGEAQMRDVDEDDMSL